MKVSREDFIAGLPALELRKLLRRHYDFGWFVESIARTLGTTRDQAQSILEELQDLGFVRQSRMTEGRQVWEVELKGRQFAKASAGPSFRRETAEAHLAAFLNRVRQLAEHPDFPHKVRKAILFGSFLDEDRERVGDVDIALDLVFKEPDRGKAMKLADEYVRLAHARGRQFGSFVDQLFAAQNDARKSLKGRSRVLQFTSIDDPILELAPQKVIYEAD